MKHFSFLVHKTSLVLLLINPVAFDFIAYSGSPNPDKTISFNSNYYYHKVPIGIITGLKSIGSPKLENRPIFTIKKDGTATIVSPKNRVADALLETQAGPWLIKDSQIENPKLQGFSSGTIRATKRIYLGTLPTGKLLLLYSSDYSLIKSRDILKKHGCINAMSLDGGSSAMLWVEKETWGNKRSKIPVGIYLLSKKKSKV